MKKKFKKYTKRFLKFVGKYLEFSKIVCYITMAVVFYTSHRILDFADMSISKDYMGSLPYVTTMTSVVWGAYATVLSFIINKSKAENKIKIEKSYDREYYGDEHTPSDSSDGVYNGGV